MRSFSLGDFGQMYPIARGTAPLVVTVLAAVFVGEADGARRPGWPSPAAGLVGVALWGRARVRDPAARLAAAWERALYRRVHRGGRRGRTGGDTALGYIAWLMILEGLLIPPTPSRPPGPTPRPATPVRLARRSGCRASVACVRTGAVGPDPGTAGPGGGAPRVVDPRGGGDRGAVLQGAVRAAARRRAAGLMVIGIGLMLPRESRHEGRGLRGAVTEGRFAQSTRPGRASTCQDARMTVISAHPRRRRPALARQRSGRRLLGTPASDAGGFPDISAPRPSATGSQVCPRSAPTSCRRRCRERRPRRRSGRSVRAPPHRPAGRPAHGSGPVLSAGRAEAAMGLRALTVTLTNCGEPARAVERLSRGTPAGRAGGAADKVEIDRGARRSPARWATPGPKPVTVAPGHTAPVQPGVAQQVRGH